jgi:peptidoglycan L-alanyl-D-glutamate endopeptidase CwlK
MSATLLDPKGFLTGVHPELAKRVKLMAGVLRGKGIPVQVTAGYRTAADQDALYAKGRTAPGDIVTNAKGGQSYHNFRLAVDIWPVDTKNNVVWSTPESSPLWQVIGQASQEQGLNWGGKWKFLDLPHHELPVPLTLTQLKAIYATGGPDAVVAEINKVLPMAVGGLGLLALAGLSMWLLKP